MSLETSANSATRREHDILTAKAVLERNYLFRDLPESSLDQIAAAAQRRTFNRNVVIFSQGDAGDALYGVASGRVRIAASGGDGREVFLNIMEPGDTFGEIAVIDGLPRTAGAIAIDTTTLVVIKRYDFLSILKRETTLSMHLLKLFCERLRWTSDLVEESAFLVGPARLAKRLLVLAALHGRPGDQGMELALSQSELAHFLGISRQIVNQHLQCWRKNGWVELARSRIIVTDAAALSEVVDEAIVPV